MSALKLLILDHSLFLAACVLANESQRRFPLGRSRILSSVQLKDCISFSSWLMLDKAEKQLQTLSRHRDLKGFLRPKAVNQINHKIEIIMDYNSHHLSVCGQVW